MSIRAIVVVAAAAMLAVPGLVSSASAADQCIVPTQTPGTWEAANPRHGLRVCFTPDGVDLAPLDHAATDAPPVWQWGLRLTGYGYEGSLCPPGEPTLSSNGNRIEYQRGELTEWYINDERGLEQGFTIHVPPSPSKGEGWGGGLNAAPLRIDLAIEGTLVPSLRADGQAIEFRESVSEREPVTGEAPAPPLLTYDSLVAFDATGRRLPASMSLDARTITLRVDDADAVYPIVIDPLVANEKAKITPSVSQFQRAGSSVAIDGDDAVIGAPGFSNNKGSAFRCHWTGSEWSTVQLNLTGVSPGDQFGYSVGISGDRIAVGSPYDDDQYGNSQGSVRVYRRIGPNNWTLEQKIFAALPDGGDLFGWSVSISGSTLAAGAPGAGSFYDTGAVFVLVRNENNVWQPQANLFASDAATGQGLGVSVSLDGDTLVAGAKDANNHRGAAYVFTREGTSWTQATKLLASDGVDGDEFGGSVSVSGDHVVVGARWHDGPFTNHGAAYVFAKPAGGWNAQPTLNEAATLLADDAAAEDLFGQSVAISTDAVVVGAMQAGDEPGIPDQGAIYFFVEPEAGWSGDVLATDKATASDGQAYDGLGYAVALTGNRALAGAPLDDFGSTLDSGSAYHFELQPCPATDRPVSLLTPELICRAACTPPSCSNMYVAVAESEPEVLYQLRRNGTPVGITVEGNGCQIVLSAATQLLGPATLDVTATRTDAACPTVVLDQTLDINIVTWGNSDAPPVIVQQPEAKHACPGSDLTLSVTALGAPTLFYQWRKDGVNLSDDGLHIFGTVSHTLHINDALLSDSGDYDVIVAHNCGLTTSAVATVTVSAVPTITQQPANASTCDGGLATFTVAAEGPGTLTYQWRKDGVDLADGGNVSGATSATLSISPASAADLANYTVVVTDDCGSIESGAATLALGAGLTITQQPVDQFVPEGSLATFTVGVSSGGSVFYQWRKDGAPLSDAGPFQGTTSPTLLVYHASANEEGTYDVLITGDCGNALSAGTTLTISQPAPCLPWLATLGSNSPDPGDQGGRGVAIDGDTAVIGAPFDDYGAVDCGAAYVLENNNGMWVVVSRLKPSPEIGEIPNGYLGHSVAIEGDVIVVGAPRGLGQGHTYVYVRPAEGWPAIMQPTARLVGLGPGEDGFGYSVDISGNTIAVGSPYAVSYEGRVLIYVEPGGGWGVGPGYQNATDVLYLGVQVTTSDFLGHSVSIFGDTVVAGARGYDLQFPFVPDGGAAFVFSRPPAGWGTSAPQWVRLSASDAAAGDQFGSSASIDGDTVVVGARYDDLAAEFQGSAYVFVKPPGGWANMTQTAKLTAADGAADDYFGQSIVITGDTVLVGADGDDAGRGAAYIFERPAEGWTNLAGTLRLTAPNAHPSAFGTSVAIAQGRALVGAIGANGAGAAYLFDLLTEGEPVSIATQPGDATVCAGAAATFTVTAAGTTPFYYQWRRNGVALVNDGGYSGVTTGTLTIAPASETHEGSYDVVVTNGCGHVTSSSATLTVITGPTITQQPTEETLCAGDSLTMKAVGNGLPPLAYQWYKDGTELVDDGRILGVSTSMLIINPLIPSDAGQYYATVSNTQGSITSELAMLTVKTQPDIDVQPESVETCVGLDAVFNVQASGMGMLTYQWRKNGVDLIDGGPVAGATTETLTITPVGFPSEGTYHVLVTDTCGSVLSEPAELSFNGVAPQISQQPVGDGVCAGGAVAFTFTATGSPPPVYQWRRDGVNIAGATDPTLVLDPVQTADFGNYEVLVSNFCASVISESAPLVNIGATGTFPSPYTSYDINPNPGSIAAGDLDHDGDADLLAGAYFSDILVFLRNNGDGTFDPPVYHSTNLPRLFSITLADFDDDGNLDAVVAGFQANQVAFIPGNGDGTFGTAVELGGLPGPQFVTHADMDGDGDPDIVAGYVNGIDVLLNDGFGSFTSISGPQDGQVLSIALQDFDADGDLDAVAARGSSLNRVDIYSNNGSGNLSFQQSYTADTWPYSVAAADIDDDDDQDFIVANYFSDNISVFANNGNATFTHTGTYAACANTAYVAGADVDSDLDIDAIAVGSSGSLNRNMGGDFSALSFLNTNGVEASGLVIADLNEDGALDIATTLQVEKKIVILYNALVYAPDITQQPIDQFASAGQSASFTITATGNPAPSYQWRREGVGLSDGGSISGATTPTLTINPVLIEDAGSYDCVLTSGACDVVSESAILSVETGPVVSQQPISQTVCSGDPATFAISVSGVGPFSFQWRKDGVDLADGGNVSGATTASLTIDPATGADTGDYDVVVSTARGSETSASASLTVVPCDPASFTPLGDLPDGEFRSIAYAVSDDGAVVAGIGRSGPGGPDEAFRWTCSTGMAGLGFVPPNGTNSVALGVSAEGSIVVGQGSGSVTTAEAFRWTAADGMVSLGDLPGGDFRSSADDVSDDGSVVVGYSTTAPGDEAFRWTAGGGMVGLGDLPGASFASTGSAVSGDGSVVVGYSNSGAGTQAFRWTAGTGMLGLGDLPGGSIFGFYSAANAVSSDGLVAVGQSDSSNGFEAFRWAVGSGMVGLGDLPGGAFSSNAFGVSGDGSIIVGQSVTAGGDDEAFIWDAANGMRNLRTILIDEHGLDLTGWVLGSANAISVDGKTIVGYGVNPGGNLEAWRVKLPGPSNPYIIEQPASQTVCIGDPVTFTVIASGTGVLNYQWRQDGQDIVGANVDSYTISVTSGADGGVYDVVVSSACGAITSDGATLTVESNLSISQQPMDQMVCLDDPVAFAVSICGVGPFSFQWRKDGVDLADGGNVSGATTASLTIDPATSADTGGYDVVVSTARESETSASATLTVVPCDPASFTPLGDLPGGDFRSIARAVSVDGSVVVGIGRSGPGGADEAFRWTCTGGMAGLGFLPSGGMNSEALGVSANGSVVVGYSSGTVNEAFRWTSAGGMVGLGDLPGGDFRSSAQGVSADGSVVVGYSTTAPGDEAFRWTAAGGMVGLGDLPGGGFSSVGNDVSGDGTVIVGQSNSGAGTQAFRWTAALDMVGLGDLPGGSIFGFYSAANAVSSDGLVAVGQSDSSNGFEAFRSPVGSGMVGLGDLPGGGFSSNAFGVSGDGSIVVGQSTTMLGDEAIIWDATNGMRNLRTVLIDEHGLDLSGWVLSVANAISADGKTIVGYGVNPGGNLEAWRVRLPATSSPFIIEHPASQAVCVGDPVTLAVVASGTDQLGYQWRQDGVDIVGANATSYSIAAVSPDDAGSYDVVVSNTCGTATSDPATLTVGSGPAISEQPQPQTASAGETAAFSVVATGDAPLAYQWRRERVPLIDGGHINGATTAVLTLDPVFGSDAGTYDVSIENDCGEILSDGVLLTVIVEPGDFDGDGDVDLDDYMAFEACLTEPGTTLLPGCDPFDLDGDGDVDVEDFAGLQNAFTSM